MPAYLSAQEKLARLQKLIDDLSGGSIIVYSGTLPTDGSMPGDAISLVTVTLKAPAGAIINGIGKLYSCPIVTVANSGVATWARLLTSGGINVLDTDVGTLDGSGIKLSTVNLISGQTFLFNGMTLSEL